MGEETGKEPAARFPLAVRNIKHGLRGSIKSARPVNKLTGPATAPRFDPYHDRSAGARGRRSHTDAKDGAKQWHDGIRGTILQDDVNLQRGPGYPLERNS